MWWLFWIVMGVFALLMLAEWLTTREPRDTEGKTSRDSNHKS
jgi:hypothetical protein